jgi:hypothetical protein
VSSVSYGLGFYIPEDGVPYSHRRKNLKYYKRWHARNWRNLCNEELHNLYSAPKDEVRIMLIGFWWESQKRRGH